MSKAPEGFIHPDDPKAAIMHMHRTSGAFYAAAVRGSVHAFIEFTGFMNEYIKMCEDAHAAGVDFVHTNAHGGDERPLPMETYHAEYIAEKFNCIFGPSFRANPAALKLFIDKLKKG